MTFDVGVGISTEQGQVVRFVVQFEYRVASDWRVVVRFDHDPASAVAHDVTDEGIHMDVYRNGEKWRSEEVFPPISRERHSHTPKST